MSTAAKSTGTPAAGDDQIRPFTRALAAIVVPVLIAAFGMLYFFPHNSDALFAWPVGPTMTAMMLGATYLGGAYFFLWVLFGSRWQEVKLGFLPVSAFAAILGISTLLHWDRFTAGHISFILWALLYFTLPFLLPLAWYRNQSSVTDGERRDELRLSRPVRALFAALGVVLTAASMLLLMTPELMIPIWPWALTPLTARVVAAMFVLPGLVGLGLALDGRWRTARHIMPAQALATALILLAVVRAAGEVDWSSLGAWLFVGSLGFVLALAAVVMVRASPATAEPAPMASA